MANIIKLHERLANQIAAGEVVERPASVVKELVENAIDANSTSIEIEVEEGGLKLIRVRDNGDGIERDDCELAFHRHATSKIREERDLFHIRTLGFRGEALPSIASVSKMEVKTCTGNGPGTYIEMEAGTLKKKSSASSRKGTEVTVRHLFYNTPARLKYMKTVHTELGNISDIVQREAMAHPEITFRLSHNGKQLLKTNGSGDLLHVIASIYGTSVAKNMIAFQAESLDFQLSGYLAKPEITRASRHYLSVFINGRYIKNHPIFKAILEGYHTLLPIGRFPIAVVHIEMDPALIDINVHPSKLEARLSKEKELTALLTEAIRDSFRNADLIPDARNSKREKRKGHQESLPFQFHKPNEIETKDRKQQEFFRSGTSVDLIYDSNRKKNDINEVKETMEKTAEMPPSSVREETEGKQPAKVEEKGETHSSIGESTPRERIPPLYPIGQMHGTYLLAQNEDGLYIIDQHAAQERVKYEFYRKKVAQVKREVQELLVPLTFEFNQSEAVQIEEHRQALNEVGVFLEPFGHHSYIVRSHPQWFPKGEEEEIIQAMIELVLETKNVDMEKLREDAAIMMACKRSIKANQYLSEDEMMALIESLRSCETPFTCPHGRPVIVHFSTYDMKKMFKRVM
mgnify:CR=1 FL=1